MYCTLTNPLWQTAALASTYNTHTIHTLKPNLYWSKCSYTQWVVSDLFETEMRPVEILEWCVPSCNFEMSQAVSHSKQRSQKDPHPNRSISSSSSCVSSSCPQTWQPALSCLQSPLASNTAFTVPGFAARTLCLIKGPWNGNGQAKRRREEDAWCSSLQKEEDRCSEEARSSACWAWRERARRWMRERDSVYRLQALTDWLKELQCFSLWRHTLRERETES